MFYSKKKPAPNLCSFQHLPSLSIGITLHTHNRRSPIRKYFSFTPPGKMHVDHHPPISLDSCGSSASWDNNYSRNRRSTGVVHPHEEAQQVPLAKRRKLEHSAAPTPGTATAPFWRGSVQDDRYYIVTPTPPFDADDVDVEMMDKEQHQQEAVEVPSIQRCGSDIVQVCSFAGAVILKSLYYV